MMMKLMNDEFELFSPTGIVPAVFTSTPVISSAHRRHLRMSPELSADVRRWGKAMRIVADEPVSCGGRVR
jgi:hypothetical protein